MANPVSGLQLANKLHGELVRAGIVGADERIRRIVIDIDVSSVPVMYIERYCDERILDVIPALAAVEIRTTPEDTVGRKNKRNLAEYGPEPQPGGIVDDRSRRMESRGGDRVDWAHAEPGHPLPELPPEKDALEPEAGYEPEDQ